jgi:ppGpp synthetase/RelA/SpoT-type nucleotidyltranferase
LNLSLDEARRRYVAEFANFLAAAIEIEEYLKSIARLAGVHADIDAREKTVSSFIKKLHLKGDQYSDPWRDVTDKVGARIIVDTIQDRAKVRSIFEDQGKCPLVVKRVEDKAAEADTAILYYPGIHVQVVVPEATTSDHEAIECEVQLRTKAQDLWSVPSHKLVYKPVLEPSRESRRRIMRLSVLVEIFDEEVDRAMAEVASMPGYEEARLLAAAESQYFTFVSEPGERELSFEVLQRLLPVVEGRHSADYGTSLGEFANLHRDKLQKAYDTYGPYSEFAKEWGYWLMSQPESIIVWQLIETAPLLLASLVAGTDLEDSVRKLYAIWGSAFPASA